MIRRPAAQLVALTLLVFSTAASASLVLTEVDLSSGTIELTNIGASAQTGTSLDWCIPFVYGTIESGGYSFLPGETRTYSISSSALSSADQLWIYSDRLTGGGTGNFFDVSPVVTGVVWGASQAGQGRIDPVVAIGSAWTSNTDFVNTSSLGPGDTIRLTNPGTGSNQSSNWFIGPNDLAQFTELLLGDFDRDGTFGVADIDLLTQTVRTGAFDSTFDLNGDGMLSGDDRVFWVEQVAETRFGDVDLSGSVEFSDFLSLSRNFGISGGGWASGDFDGNGDVGFPDFLELSRNFGQTAASSTAYVPEPTTRPWILFATCVLLRIRRRS